MKCRNYINDNIVRFNSIGKEHDEIWEYDGDLLKSAEEFAETYTEDLTNMTGDELEQLALEYETNNKKHITLQIYEYQKQHEKFPSRYENDNNNFVYESYKWKYNGAKEYVIIPSKVDTLFETFLFNNTIKGVALKAGNNIADMYGAFKNIKNEKKSLELKYLDTSDAKKTNSMFAYSLFDNLDLSGFNTNNVTHMNEMFLGSNINKLDVSKFDTIKVEYMQTMFENSIIKEVDLSSFYIKSNVNLTEMFKKSQIEKLNIAGFEGKENINKTDMFSNLNNCSITFKNQDEIDFFSVDSGLNLQTNFIKIKKWNGLGLYVIDNKIYKLIDGVLVLDDEMLMPNKICYNFKEMEGSGTFKNVILIGKSIPADNYVSEVDAVESALNQQMSVIKGELWYDINNGMPLFEKKLNKILLDSHIASVVYSNEKVIDITNYQSKVEKNKFYCDLTIQTVYGDVKFVI